MKKVLFLLVFSIFVVGAGFIINLKSNPPLVINGFTNIEGNADMRLIEIENRELRELQLQNILINDELPKSAELVVSKSEPLVAGVKLESNPNITYHKVKQVNIFPSKYIDREAIGEQPQHYGLKIGGKNIKTITIHYTYLKIPFTLTAELETDL